MCYTIPMKQIRDTYRKTGRLHHAYGILGGREKSKAEIRDFLLKELKFPVTKNPDFWEGEHNVFKIADSRALCEAHLNRPVKHSRKVFVIYANFITKDAQNSLLKIFEDPTPDTVFFLVLPAQTGLIATLKSRLIFGQASVDDTTSQAETFLKAKIGKRMEMVAKIVKDIKDEKINKSDAIKFIKNLEKEVKVNLKVRNAHNARSGSLLAIEDLEKAISYVNDESPSIKVILEHLALVL